MTIIKEKICIVLNAGLICIGMYLEKIHYKIYPFYPPVSWGLVKDMVDPLLVLMFPWNGWIVFFPMTLAFYFRLRFYFFFGV